MFVMVYARYMRALGTVNRRNEKLEVFQERISGRIKGLQAAGEHLKMEIQTTKDEIMKLERRLQDAAESYDEDESGKSFVADKTASPAGSDAVMSAGSSPEADFDDPNTEDLACSTPWSDL